MSAAAAPQEPLQAGEQVQYVMQAPMPQGVVYAQAPQPVAYAGAQPMQYTYMAPPAGTVQQVVLQDGQQVYTEGAEAQQMMVQEGQQVVLQGGQYTYAAAPEGQQVVMQDGQQVVYQGEQFAYTTPEGGEMVQAGAEPQQLAFYGAPMIAAAPARVT